MKHTPEDARLKEFVEDHFDFDGLKSAGFWPKGVRRSDFKAQAARVCHFFGFASIYEYNPPEIIEVPGGAIAQGAGSITAQGEYEPGMGGWLSTTESHFECPACTCWQEIRNPQKQTQRCAGCKRKLGVVMDMVGKIHVWEE